MLYFSCIIQRRDRMKTGLVLEGGANRTIFSSGATDALLSGGLMADYVIGVSAGIAYGVSYVSRQIGRNLEILTKFANDKRYMGARNLLDRHNRAYYNLQFTYDEIPNRLVPFDYETFAAYPGEIEAVVTDVHTGKAVYQQVPRQDSRFLVLQATCAMPLLFPIIHLEDGGDYLDGGVADAIPYRRALERCDRVIVVLTRERGYVKKPESLQRVMERRYRKYPAFCRAMQTRAERYNQAREELFRLEKQGKVLVICPKDTRGFHRTERDLNKIRALYASGFTQTQKRLDELRCFWNQ